MSPPASVIDPSTASADATCLIEFLNDDWDHWDSAPQMSTCLARRDRPDLANPRAARTLAGEPIDDRRGDGGLTFLEAG